MGYYQAGGYYEAGGFFKKLGKLVGKVAPAVSLINPALGSALALGGKLANAGAGRGPPPVASFPGMGQRRPPRRSYRRRRRY